MTNLIDLSGRTILITGAAQGIGQGVAELALSLGASVAAMDVNGEHLRAWAATQPADRVMTIEGSVADHDFVHASVRKIVERFGDVNGLVNNAGIVRAAMIEKMTAQQWRDVVDVNMTGAFNCLQAVGAHMVARAQAGEKVNGSIVNVSSDAGRKGSVGQINYSATKSALLGMTMSAAREWSKFGIRVNSICFGVVETPMTATIRGNEKFSVGLLQQIPMGRWSKTTESSPPICFMLSDAASYVTGQHLSVNGGYHIGF
ncbi:MAG: SDR family NAD(P)-dependent oxidoreductase [Alphaproteobacteria bacterium]|nr:SDR family NAD(P)-dependent oxidoreductase [Alphaproteobacteria bacterium]